MKKVNKQIAPTPRMKTLVKATIDEDGITWFTAQQITKRTGWDYRDLEIFREEGNLKTKEVGKKGKRYDLDSVIALYKKLQELKSA